MHLCSPLSAIILQYSHITFQILYFFLKQNISSDKLVYCEFSALAEFVANCCTVKNLWSLRSCTKAYPVRKRTFQNRHACTILYKPVPSEQGNLVLSNFGALGPSTAYVLPYWFSLWTKGSHREGLLLLCHPREVGSLASPLTQEAAKQIFLVNLFQTQWNQQVTQHNQTGQAWSEPMLTSQSKWAGSYQTQQILVHFSVCSWAKELAGFVVFKGLYFSRNLLIILWKNQALHISPETGA